MKPIGGVKKQEPGSMHPVLKKATETVTNPVKLGETAKKAFDGYQKVRTLPKDVRTAAQALKRDGFQAATKNAFQKTIDKGMNPKDPLTRLGVLKKVSGAVGTVTNAVKLPGQAITAYKDVRDAVRSGSASSRDKAIGSAATAVKTGISTVKGGLELGRDVQKFRGSYRAASEAFRATAPKATPKAVRAAATSAAKSAFQGATESAASKGSYAAVRGAAKESTIARTVGARAHAAAKVLAHEGAEAAGKAAVQAGTRAAASSLAKAAGRFAPGANIAIAALDVAGAYSTMKDPKASTTKKVASIITAIGSVASATNIPVVSQVGAAVSTVSSFVGGFF